MTDPRRILLAISGGIAAYKTPELVRALKRAGHEVRCALTPHAERFVAPLALQAVSGQSVRKDLFDPGEEGEIDRYPTPDEMWDAVYGESEAQEAGWRDRFSAVPVEDKGGQWQARYYQHNAITRALEVDLHDLPDFRMRPIGHHTNTIRHIDRLIGVVCNDHRGDLFLIQNSQDHILKLHARQ